MSAHQTHQARGRGKVPDTRTPWQRERACGPLLPLAEARKPGLLARIFGR